MNYQEQANVLRDTADALEDAQRALQHLDALVDAWEECTDEERREGVLDARSRLNGTWSRRP